MKRLVVSAALAVVAATSIPAFAQSPGAAPPPGTTTPHAESAGPHQMAQMCHHMMAHMAAMGDMGGGMMARGMMGSGMMAGGDPRQQADMMAMRGEMLKAMGDIMLKYSQRMQVPAR